MQKQLRKLPKVGSLLDSAEWAVVLARFRRDQVKMALETELEAARREIVAGAGQALGPTELLKRVEARLGLLYRGGPRPVLNATGVIIHTNLGRAPLAAAAMAAASEAAGYCNLELELASGQRGSRHDHIEALVCSLTGAEGALVVNNNAAAVMLALRGVAAGSEGIISRGQLVEIGGSFRVPEVMTESGIRLVEVGTTNRTRIEDYRRAIGPATGVILRVHPSNFRVVGFQQEVPLAELVSLGREHGLPVLDDLGSGTLVDLQDWGIEEPTVQQSVAAGADLICFSGDKLLGGPQCGIIVGHKDWIERLKTNPLARALRVDKFRLAALAATLALYLQPDGWRKIPVLAMLTEKLETVGQRAKQLAALLQGLPADVEVVPGFSPVGGGALPLLRLETYAVQVRPVHTSAAVLAQELRLGSIPLVARVHDQAVLLDARTLAAEHISPAATALAQALQGGGAGGK